MPPIPRLGLVEPLGLLGQETRRLLADGDLAWLSVTLLGSSEFGGSLTEFAGEPALVHAIEPGVIAELDALLIAGPVSAETRELLHRSNKLVVDARDCEDDGDAVVPGGRARATGHWRRLASPATVALAPLVDVIRTVSELTRFAAVVFEPVAEHGDPGIDELHHQTIETLNLAPATTAVLGARRAFDLRPEFAVRPAHESRIARDLAQVAELDLRAEVSLIAAPVFLGLAALVSIELEDDVRGVDIAAALAEDARFVLCPKRPATPGDLPNVDGDPIFAAVAPDDGVGRARIWLACDYIRHCRARAALEVLRAYARA